MHLYNIYIYTLIYQSHPPCLICMWCMHIHIPTYIYIFVYNIYIFMHIVESHSAVRQASVSWDALNIQTKKLVRNTRFLHWGQRTGRECCLRGWPESLEAL